MLGHDTGGSSTRHRAESIDQQKYNANLKTKRARNPPRASGAALLKLVIWLSNCVYLRRLLSSSPCAEIDSRIAPQPVSRLVKKQSRFPAQPPFFFYSAGLDVPSASIHTF